ncbi:ABC transporter permease [Terribacillus halophilus]|uniref:ABC transporter permease n=1 Tax=Terribacillus halophilus TaxID=361279 RepID=UPI0015C31FDB|nr:ABC transporter permease [Terribacillus halophilus]
MIAKRVGIQLLRDKRTLLMMFVAPILVLFLLYSVLNAGSGEIQIGIVGDEAFKVEGWENYSSVASAKADMKKRELDAFVIPEEFKIIIEGTENTKRNAAYHIITDQLEQENLNSSSNTPVHTEYMYGGKHLSAFEEVGPAIMGFFIFLYVFITSGVSFLRERTFGTLERSLATSIRRSYMLIGYFLGYLPFVACQAFIIEVFVIFVLDVPLEGSLLLLTFVTLVIACVALALGLLLSVFAKNEFQLIQFIPILLVPQILFSGLFDITGGGQWINTIANLMPLSFATRILNAIMLRGEDINWIWSDLLILCSFFLIFVMANSIMLRKERPF